MLFSPSAYSFLGYATFTIHYGANAGFLQKACAQRTLALPYFPFCAFLTIFLFRNENSPKYILIPNTIVVTYGTYNKGAIKLLHIM
jgi:hypothetical protein